VAALGPAAPPAVAAAPGFRTNDIASAGFNIRGFAAADLAHDLRLLLKRN